VLKGARIQAKLTCQRSGPGSDFLFSRIFEG
jgi:hypothetical protein